VISFLKGKTKKEGLLSALTQDTPANTPKRQMTWFRNQMDVEWSPLRPGYGGQVPGGSYPPKLSEGSVGGWEKVLIPLASSAPLGDEERDHRASMEETGNGLVENRWWKPSVENPMNSAATLPTPASFIGKRKKRMNFRLRAEELGIGTLVFQR